MKDIFIKLGKIIATIVLAFSLTIGFTNGSIVKAFELFNIAIPDDGTSGDSDYPEYPNQGSVRMEKTTAWTNYAQGNADVTFDIWGKEKQVGADTVLVIDNSVSTQDPNTATRDGSYDTDVLASGVSSRGGFTYVGAEGQMEVIGMAAGKINGVQQYLYTYLQNVEVKNGDEKYYTPVFYKDPDIRTTPQYRNFDPNWISDPNNMIVYFGGSDGTTNLTHVYEIFKSRLQVEKEAAIQFADTYFKDGTTSNTLSIVTFAGFQNLVETPITESSSLADVTAAINGIGISTKGGTDYQIGLQKAKDILDKNTDNRPEYTVLVTDGTPNLPSDSSADPGKDNQYGKTVADSMKNTGVDIYTIGLELTQQQADILSSLATEGHSYVAEGSDLIQVFQQIAGFTLIAGTNAELTDYIDLSYFNINPNYVDPQGNVGGVSLYKETAVGSGVFENITNQPLGQNRVDFIYDTDGTTIKGLKINVNEINPTISRIVIHLQLKEDDSSWVAPDENGEYPTNDGDARVTYLNFNNVNCSQSVKTPVLRRPDTVITVEYYLADEQGNPINNNGTIVDFQNRIELTGPTNYVDCNGNITSTLVNWDDHEANKTLLNETDAPSFLFNGSAYNLVATSPIYYWNLNNDSLSAAAVDKATYELGYQENAQTVYLPYSKTETSQIKVLKQDFNNNNIGTEDVIFTIANSN
ncbi:MAG: VWA domain-containing protein, partial [Lactobacillaceae bacterium]|nr:VWA domain-containing protein [Lactobacillaceae bacterium]